MINGVLCIPLHKNITGEQNEKSREISIVKS